MEAYVYNQRGVRHFSLKPEVKFTHTIVT